MRLITIEKAIATATPGVMILTLRVDMGRGNIESVPVTYDPENLTPLTSEAANWMTLNPGLYIEPHNPPSPDEGAPA